MGILHAIVDSSNHYLLPKEDNEWLYKVCEQMQLNTVETLERMHCIEVAGPDKQTNELKGLTCVRVFMRADAQLVLSRGPWSEGTKLFPEPEDEAEAMEEGIHPAPPLPQPPAQPDMSIQQNPDPKLPDPQKPGNGGFNVPPPPDLGSASAHAADMLKKHRRR